MSTLFHIVIIAGEPSGDQHGARLVKALFKAEPTLIITGIGGSALAKTGIQLLVRSEQLALVGISEVLGKINHIWRAFSIIKHHLYQTRPNLVILIDYPDFNFRVAAVAKKLGLKVLYYISPQVWAWRQQRVHKLSKLVDHLAVVFPFEINFFQKLVPQLPVSFVGHPLLDELEENNMPLMPQQNDLIGLLPGSRMSQIIYLAPLLLETAKILSYKQPTLHFVLLIPPGLSRKQLNPYLPDTQNLTVISENALQFMAKAKLLIMTSGTATLQATLARVPMIVVYKTGYLNYILAKHLIKIKYIAMPNLIAGRALVPELIQQQATPKNISNYVLKLLADKHAQLVIKKGLDKVVQQLGSPGASQRTAELALFLLRK